LSRQSKGTRSADGTCHADAHCAGDSLPLTILLADDHMLVRQGFKMILDSQPDMQVVGEMGVRARDKERSDALILGTGLSEEGWFDPEPCTL
jgi:hypothetical protein